MTDDDLAELEDTRATAEAELKTIRGRMAVLEELERDRDALLESYAGMMPDALDSLTPEDRCRVYGMLRLNVRASADGTMQARGVLNAGVNMQPDSGERLCENGLASACDSRNTKSPEFRFRILPGDEASEVQLTLA